jgi:hypothetical protein
VDFIDLILRCFKHGSDLGKLVHLQEAGELVGGHCQIGAWSLENIMAINAKKLFIEVALEWPPLRVKLLLGHHEGVLICSALCMVDISVLVSGVFLLDLAVPRGLSTLTLKIAPPREEGEEIVQWRFR